MLGPRRGTSPAFSTSEDAHMAHRRPLFAVSMHRRLNHRCAVNKNCNFHSRIVPMQWHLYHVIIPVRLLLPLHPLPPKPSDSSPLTDISHGVLCGSHASTSCTPSAADAHGPVAAPNPRRCNSYIAMEVNPPTLRVVVLHGGFSRCHPETLMREAWTPWL